MFEIRKKEPISSEPPVRNFQKGLEYETDQVHLWLLSHKEATAGFVVYLLQDKKMIIHVRPDVANSALEIKTISSSEEMRNEAIFILRKFRKKGGMKKLLVELFSEANHLGLHEIDVIDVSEKWLAEKLKEILTSSGYDQLYEIYPNEGEGGRSLVARKGAVEKIMPQSKREAGSPTAL